MTALLIFIIVLSLLRAAVNLMAKPGTKKTAWSAGELVFGFVFHGAIAGWALYLLVERAA